MCFIVLALGFAPSLPNWFSFPMLPNIVRFTVCISGWCTTDRKARSIQWSCPVPGTFQGLILDPWKSPSWKKKSTTTRRYIDHAGKRRYCGTKALKETQKLTSYRSTLFFSLFHYSDDISNKFPMCFPGNCISFPQGHILQALPVLWLICFHTCRSKKKRHLST